MSKKMPFGIISPTYKRPYRQIMYSIVKDDRYYSAHSMYFYLCSEMCRSHNYEVQSWKYVKTGWCSRAANSPEVGIDISWINILSSTLHDGPGKFEFNLVQRCSANKLTLFLLSS